MKSSFTKFSVLLLVSLLIYAPVLGQRASNPDAYLTFPSLMEVGNPLQYFQLLLSFNVIDFQPVRDLTFFIDLFIFRHTGVVSFATINVILWALAGFLLLQILERNVPEERRRGGIFWVILFLCFPLFSQAVPWGMARKHILAFPLILSATVFYLDWLEGKKKWYLSYLFYVAASLSHPIVLLWPVWAFAHRRAEDPPPDKEFRYILTAFAVTAGVLLLLNLEYYTIGNAVVADTFWKASPDLSNVSALMLKLGFAFKQMVFPFQLSFLYWPDLKSSWPGFLAIIALGVLVFRSRHDKKIFTWLLFGFLSFPITLTLPNFFDQYLILPAAGILIVLFRKFHRPGKKEEAGLLMAAALALSFVTFEQARIWKSEIRFTERNFRNRPTCKHALDFALKTYEEKQRAPSDLVTFIQEKQCLLVSPTAPAGIFRTAIYVQSMMLFFEDERFDRELRVSKLKAMGQIHYFPQLVYAAILGQERRPAEVEEAAAVVRSRMGAGRLPPDVIITDVLRPYCEKERLPVCLQVTDFEKRPPLPF